MRVLTNNYHYFLTHTNQPVTAKNQTQPTSNQETNMIGKYLQHTTLNGIRLNELVYSKLVSKKNERLSVSMTKE